MKDGMEEFKREAFKEVSHVSDQARTSTVAVVEKIVPSPAKAETDRPGHFATRPIEQGWSNEMVQDRRFLDKSPTRQTPPRRSGPASSSSHYKKKEKVGSHSLQNPSDWQELLMSQDEGSDSHQHKESSSSRAPTLGASPHEEKGGQRAKRTITPKKKGISSSSSSSRGKMSQMKKRIESPNKKPSSSESSDKQPSRREQARGVEVAGDTAIDTSNTCNIYCKVFTLSFFSSSLLRCSMIVKKENDFFEWVGGENTHTSIQATSWALDRRKIHTGMRARRHTTKTFLMRCM